MLALGNQTLLSTKSAHAHCGGKRGQQGTATQQGDPKDCAPYRKENLSTLMPSPCSKS
jgi:hypothetical protein